jgi:nucleotide-binding universal stress UspA family protein
MTSETGAGAFKKILVGLDGSPQGRAAAQVATRIAKRNGAELIILTVLPLPVAMIGGEAYPMAEEEVARARKAGEELLEEEAAKAEGEGVQPKKVVMERRDSVVRSILDYSEKQGVDLIVVGTRGLGGLRKMLLGSVASGLTEYAHCSVLVVR